MNQTKMMSASMMMRQELDELTEKFDVETRVLGRYDIHKSDHWREYTQQLIKCSMIEGKIEILKKMINQLSSMNIELPQLTNV